MRFKKVISAFMSAVICVSCLTISANAAVMGDANGDGKLNIRDSAFIASGLIAGKNLPATADFNGDGKVNVRDAAAIATYLINVQRANTMIALINKERKKLGRGSLALNINLMNMANVRAKEIVKKFSHERPNGKSCFSIFDDNGIIYSAAGENIAAGRSTPEDTYEQWKNSEGHYNNMINSDFTEIGIGYYYAQGDPYRYYWVQLFRKP